MEKVQLELDKETLEQAQKLAEIRHCSLEELIQELLKQSGNIQTMSDPYLGMLAEEPELMDKVLDSVMKSREEHPLRQSIG